MSDGGGFGCWMVAVGSAFGVFRWCGLIGFDVVIHFVAIFGQLCVFFALLDILMFCSICAIGFDLYLGGIGQVFGFCFVAGGGLVTGCCVVDSGPVIFC